MSATLFVGASVVIVSLLVLPETPARLRVTGREDKLDLELPDFLAIFAKRKWS